MAKLKDLAQQVGEIKPEEGKSLKRQLQDETHIYDGRADRPSSYTEPEILRAVALYRLYGSYAQVSRETGIAVSTIYRWVNDSTSTTAKIGNFESKLESAYSKLIENSIFLMTEAQKVIHEKLPQSSAAQAATIYGILADKARYMTEGSRAGSSTSLHFDLAGLTGDEQGKLLDRVLQRQQQRQEEREAIDAEYVSVETDTETDTNQNQDTDTKTEHKRQKGIRSAQQRQDREVKKLQKLK